MTFGKLISLAVAGVLFAPAPPNPVVARVGDTGFIQLEAASFSQLTPKQKALAYDLTQASIAIDPIIYDQLGRNGLREKYLLELIASHPHGVDAATRTKLDGVTPCSAAPCLMAIVNDMTMRDRQPFGCINVVTTRLSQRWTNHAPLTHS